MDSHLYFTKHITVAFKSMTTSGEGEKERAVHMVCSCGQPGQSTRRPSGTVSGQRPEPCKEKTQTDYTCIVVLSLEEVFD